MNKYTIEQLETMFAKNRANLSKTRIDQNKGLFLNRLFTLSSIAFGAGSQQDSFAAATCVRLFKSFTALFRMCR